MEVGRFRLRVMLACVLAVALALPAGAFAAPNATKAPHTAASRAIAVDPADDDISGTPAVPPLNTVFQGSLTAGVDEWDVYKVTLSEGDKIFASLTGAPGTDFDFFLFAPNTPSVTGDYVWDSSNDGVYPEQFTYVVPPLGAGDYFLGVNRFEGSGTYQMLVDKAPKEADDDIAGVTPPGPSFNGDLNRYSDADDVFHLNLQPGDKVKFELAGPSTADFDAYVYGPDQVSVYTGTPFLSADTFSSLESGSFEATTTGLHYIDLYSAFGAGAYTFKYMVGDYTQTTINAPTVLPYGGTASFTGMVETLSSGTDVVGGTVTLEARPVGMSAWTAVDTTTTVAGGAYAFSHKPAYGTDYRVQYAGLSNTYNFSTSATIRVKPKVYLTKPSTASRVRRNVRFTSSGYLRPRHSTGGHVVKLYAQRYESGRWVTRKVISTTTYSYSSTTSRYSAKVTLPYTGRWRMMARYAATTKYAATDSVLKYFTVYR